MKPLRSTRRRRTRSKRSVGGRRGGTRRTVKGNAKRAWAYSGLWNGRKALDDFQRFKKVLPIPKGAVKILQPKHTKATRRMRGGVLAPGHIGNAQKIAQVERKLGDDKSTIAYDTKMRQHYTEAAKNATGAERRIDRYDEYDYGYSWGSAERNEMRLKRVLSRLEKQ